MPERTILFVCIENSCRSLMAEALFNATAPEGWRAVSAGTRAASEPNPRTGPMLREIGLDLPSHAPQNLTPEMLDVANVVITMGCLDDASCPTNLKDRLPRDWALPDPAAMDDAGFRGVRDAIRERVRRLTVEVRATASPLRRTLAAARRSPP